MSKPNTQRYVTPSTPAMLSWKEAVAIIETTDHRGVPKPFSITFCTADQNRGTGGEIIRYARAVWYVPGGRVKKLSDQPASERDPVDAPRNFHRNIQAVDSNQPRKLHLHLILAINGHDIR
ncbi:hypothetical protein [Tellurirhabdus bombi]|uniref:hypothetical protein n=1 Tax=Tellurirhabdus bombi TaxID=2907205 RepID=UPI001F441A01|nr:hypothetical protein [Tellurirhabdus bombi]